MRLYLSLRQHPQLAPLAAHQRQAAMRLALAHIGGWRLLLLNLVKLGLLLPPFVLFARQPTLLHGLGLLLWLVLYPLLLRPLQLWLCAGLLAAAVAQIKGDMPPVAGAQP